MVQMHCPKCICLDTARMSTNAACKHSWGELTPIRASLDLGTNNTSKYTTLGGFIENTFVGFSSVCGMGRAPSKLPWHPGVNNNTPDFKSL